ncbi:MAG: energy transducer TonB [Acidobacteriota bacterium]|nr:MAG: energy transducer TonB [Acidobacteriota bacterium]
MLLACAAAAMVTVFPGSSASTAGETPAELFSYHVRVVRVDEMAPAGPDPPAKRRAPFVIPIAGLWWEDEQLTAIADAVGGMNAQSVASYLIRGDGDGHTRFERTITAEEQNVSLSLRARLIDDGSEKPGSSYEASHELSLVLRKTAPRRALAEAILLARGERTVALAARAPSPPAWIVLAVTALDASAFARFGARDPVVSGARGIEPPRIVRQVEAALPATARHARRSGLVTLRVIVDEHGVPHAPIVVDAPSRGEDLAAAAAQAALHRRYTPALQSGQPVPAFVTEKFYFAPRTTPPQR